MFDVIWWYVRFVFYPSDVVGQTARTERMVTIGERQLMSHRDQQTYLICHRYHGNWSRAKWGESWPSDKYLDDQQRHPVGTAAAPTCCCSCKRSDVSATLPICQDGGKVIALLLLQQLLVVVAMVANGNSDYYFAFVPPWNSKKHLECLSFVSRVTSCLGFWKLPQTACPMSVTWGLPCHCGIYVNVHIDGNLAWTMVSKLENIALGRKM